MTKTKRKPKDQENHHMTLPYIDIKPREGSFWEKYKGRYNVSFVSDRDDATLCIGKIEKTGRQYQWSLWEKPVKATSTLKKEPNVIASKKCGKITNAVYNLRVMYSARKLSHKTQKVNAA